MTIRRNIWASHPHGRVIGCTLAIIFGSAMPAHVATAQPAKPAADAVKAKGAEKELGITLEQAIARVRAAGYTDIEEIERERGGYEVCAKDSQGKEVDLKVDGSTGDIKILEEEDDD